MDKPTTQTTASQLNKSKKDGRGWALSSLPACRRRLARLLSDIDAGQYQDLAAARTLIFGISHIISCLKFEAELAILERLDALEQEVKRGAA